jgi:hypothetical protein
MLVNSFIAVNLPTISALVPQLQLTESQSLIHTAA